MTHSFKHTAAWIDWDSKIITAVYAAAFNRSDSSCRPISQCCWMRAEERSLAKGQKSPCPTHPQSHCHLSLTECRCVAGMLNILSSPNSCRRISVGNKQALSYFGDCAPQSDSCQLVCFVLQKVVWSMSWLNVGHASCNPLAWQDAAATNCKLHSSKCPHLWHVRRLTASASQGTFPSY